MGRFRRIGTVALQYGSARVPQGLEREREALVGYIAVAGRLGVDIGFTTHDGEGAPEWRGAFAR